jgi:hypothetical protein
MPCREISDGISGTTVDVFPNPSSSEFTLIIKSDLNSFFINIFDVAGRIVASYENVAANKEFRCGGNLANGIYFAEIISGDNREIVKLFKQAN